MLTEVEKGMLEQTKADLTKNPFGFGMESWGTCVAGRMSKAVTGDFDYDFIRQRQAAMSPLFSTSYWPRDLSMRYHREYARGALASVAIEAIDRFLAADGDAIRFQTSAPLVPAFFPTRQRATVAAAKKVAEVAGLSMLGLGMGISLASVLELMMR